MRLKVPASFKGELVIGKYNIHANNVLVVSDEEYNSSEVRMAIGMGYLVDESPPQTAPVENIVTEELPQRYIQIKNVSSKELTIGVLSFVKNETKEITEEQMNNLPISSASDIGLVEIIIDGQNLSHPPQEEIIQPEVKQDTDFFDPPFTPTPEPETKMTSWDFEQKKMLDKQESKNATLNPMPLNTTVVDKGKVITTFNNADPANTVETPVQVGDIDFLDLYKPIEEAPTPPEFVHPIEKITKETEKKAEVKIERKTKSKRKSIKPTGTIKPEKTANDAMIEEPLAKPSETVELIVNEQMHIPTARNIEFVDASPDDLDFDQNGEVD
jgi:hypothetical protein